MAYQARQRDPLFDRDTQAVLERRGTELLGVVLLLTGIAAAMIVGSYSPDDPSWLSATDEPARNLLGRMGASIASPLFVIVGYASWAIALIFGAWGLRLVTHTGEDRVLARIVFAPIAVAFAAVYASTHVPGTDWGHSFGLGGLFGDTVLGALLGVVPIQATLGLKVLSFLMFFVTMAMMLFVLGTTSAEMRGFLRFLARGTVMLFDRLVSLLGITLRSGIGGLANARERRAARAKTFEEQSLEAAPFGISGGAAQNQAGPPRTAGREGCCRTRRTPRRPAVPGRTDAVPQGRCSPTDGNGRCGRRLRRGRGRPDQGAHRGCDPQPSSPAACRCPHGTAGRRCPPPPRPAADDPEHRRPRRPRSLRHR